MALYIWVQLLEQIARDLGSVASQMFLFQKEVHSEVCFVHNGRILNRKVANAREDEVLERLNADDTRPGVYEEDVGVFKRDLAGSSPKSQLAIVPAVLS
jgi:hypothetical protein